jgi:hypothetical protein
MDKGIDGRFEDMGRSVERSQSTKKPGSAVIGVGIDTPAIYTFPDNTPEALGNIP